MFTCASREAWAGQEARLGSLAGRVQVRSGGEVDTRPGVVHVWLQAQLILMRSLMLVWMQMCTSVVDQVPGFFNSVRTELVLDFRQRCNIGKSDVSMGSVLEACGLCVVTDQRLSFDTPAGNTCWERFAY